MISEAEIRRTAAATQVDPMVMNLDYSLGWFLLGMLKTGDLFGGLIFKGGTCLRKCYFPEYRFSEDLDFTATKHLSPAGMKKWITRSGDWIRDHDGPDFHIQPIHFEVVEDEYGSESGLLFQETCMTFTT
ncbi:MAG: nucleotidyl transferase AbiEii/AbiGii toxin family protein [Anaerolineaceae bacterium]|jgi:predicted nucleotidyltransferase component of viral defense system|nr:nucleotidyl transferase AbiEii/AbiGii toxin family protein [Anaerolineaceae bacterium]